MSQPNKISIDPLLVFRYVEINRRIYKIPTFFDNPGFPEIKRDRARPTSHRDGTRIPPRYKKPRRTTERESGYLRSRSSLYDRSRALSDEMRRTEQSLREAEEDVRDYQQHLTNLQSRGAQGPTERECTIPACSDIHDRSSGSSDDVMRTEQSLMEAKEEVKWFRHHLRNLQRRRAQGQQGTPPHGSRRGTYEPGMRRNIQDLEARLSRRRRSRHGQTISRSIHTERYNTPRQGRPAFDDEGFGQVQEDRSARLTAGPRPSHASSQVQPEQSRDGTESMRPLPLFQSPSSRTPPRVKDRQLCQGSNEKGKPHGTGDVSATSDGEGRLNNANNRAETYSTSVPSDIDLNIRISYEDSHEKSQTRDDPCASSSEPWTGYVLANEEDHLANDDSQSSSTTSLEPAAEYVLANENDYLVDDDSDCEGDA